MAIDVSKILVGKVALKIFGQLSLMLRRLDLRKAKMLSTVACAFC